MRIKNFIVRPVYFLPLVVLAIGTAGFAVLEKLSFVNALYFTFVTIATVGYGDIHPTTTAGKIFCIIIITLGIGTFLALVTTLSRSLLDRDREKVRKKRLHMIVGGFYTEVGNHLLHLLSGYDPAIVELRKECIIDSDFSAAEFTKLKKRLRRHDYEIEPKKFDLEAVSAYLTAKGDFLLRQLENADLIEHETFTELLWSVVHLREELISRGSFKNLPETDLGHLSNDAKRVYANLAVEWVDYLQYLKGSYPYLFSLSLRLNPFIEKPSAVVK
jgi:voltage-gated potassium channel